MWKKQRNLQRLTEQLYVLFSDVQILVKASSILRVWLVLDIVSHLVRLRIRAHCSLALTPRIPPARDITLGHTMRTIEFETI